MQTNDPVVFLQGTYDPVVFEAIKTGGKIMLPKTPCFLQVLCPPSNEFRMYSKTHLPDIEQWSRAVALASFRGGLVLA